jgi:hypothetical protein
MAHWGDSIEQEFVTHICGLFSGALVATSSNTHHFSPLILNFSITFSTQRNIGNNLASYIQGNMIFKLIHYQGCLY